MSNAYKILSQLISGTLSPMLKEKVWEWLIHPSGRADKDAALQQVWDETLGQADQSTTESFQRFCQKVSVTPPKKPFTFNFNKMARTAAIWLIPLLSVFASWLYVNTYVQVPEQLVCQVPQGKKETIVLPDGSLVHLNAGSLLSYPRKFVGKMRTVYLMGEGNFDVTRDKNHPFVVKTNSLKIRVLGTKFNVAAYGDEEKTVTTLESGAVMVQKAGGENIATLSPNEQLEYHNMTGRYQKKIIDASIYSGWTIGELNFVSRSLKDIIKSLERAYDVRIVVPAVLNTSDLYTIKFKQQSDIEEVLNIITKTVGNLSYKKEGNNIILDYSLKKKGGK